MPYGSFHLDKTNSKLAGVCSGIAAYTGIDSLWIRLGAVLLAFLGFPLIIPIYIIIALVADKGPSRDRMIDHYNRDAEMRLLRKAERKRKQVNTPSDRLRNDLSDMDRRIADMEAHYKDSNARLAAEIEKLR